MEEITVIGSLNMDMVVRVSRMPKPGETLAGFDFHLIPGGKGANQAVAAQKAGASTRMLGCVGIDPFGKVLLESLNIVGVDTSLVRALPDISSGTATIIVDSQGQNSIVIVAGTNSLVTPDLVDQEWQSISGSSMIILQHEVPLETVAYVIKRASSEGIKVLLNPAPAHRISDELISKIDILILNEIEAETLCDSQVSDVETAFFAAESLQSRGVKTVIVTLGEKGSVLVSNEYRIHQPANKTKVVDTTAAGDTFVGGYAAELLKNNTPPQALLYATAAAGLAVTRLGAQPSVPCREEVLDFIRNSPGALEFDRRFLSNS